MAPPSHYPKDFSTKFAAYVQEKRLEGSTGKLQICKLINFHFF